MEDLEKLKDEKFDDLKVELEEEIANLEKYVAPAKLSIEALEKVEPLNEEKIKNFEAEIELLEGEIKERQDKIDLIDAEVKRRVEIRLKIEEVINEIDFDEEETHKKWDRESEAEVEYKVPIVNQFLHHMKFCDHIELKEELRVDGVLQLDDEGLPIEIVKEVKHIPWNKKAILKDLKLKLDLDKAKLLVDSVKSYKHNKKKSELEQKLRLLVQNNVYFLEAFGDESVIIKGERHGVHHSDRIAKWDKDDLEFFEAQVLKLEEAKAKLDSKEKKEKPIKDRQKAYGQIDGLLFEALVEKYEENRPDKIVKYLELRKDIKNKHPLEEE